MHSNITLCFRLYALLHNITIMIKSTVQKVHLVTSRRWGTGSFKCNKFGRNNAKNGWM